MFKVSENAVVSSNAKIGEGCVIDVGAIIYPNVELGDNSYVGPYSIIGSPTADYYNDPMNHEFKKTIIGSNAVLRSNTVIYEDCKIGNNFQTGHHVTIREKSNIGRNCSAGTLCDIQGRVNIGDFVRMHSNVHIGMFTTIEDYVWLFPYVITTNDTYPPHDRLTGCTIRKYAILGAYTTLLPGVEIGENAFLAAGSLVSKNIPQNVFAMGRPAVAKKRVEEIRDKDGNPLYPWKEYLEEYRGYPWQNEEGLGRSK